MKIAITGGIGSGKSYICNILRKKGIEIYDCDHAAKRLMDCSEVIRRQLTALVGKDAYINNHLNKQVISTFLLASDNNKTAINNIVHPVVAEDFIASGCSWMECAILYESGFYRLVDKVIAVTAPQEIREQRIMKRDNISKEKAQAWIQLQWNQQIIAQKADYELINDGIKDINEQLDRIFKNINKT